MTTILQKTVRVKTNLDEEQKKYVRHVEYQGVIMIISQINSQYIKDYVVPNVTFENIGKPCKLFNCIQVDSANVVRAMWEDPKMYAVDNHIWSCMMGFFCRTPTGIAMRDKEFDNMKGLLFKTFSHNFAIKKFAKDEHEFETMITPLLAASLEWLAYGDDPKHVWFRSMIPILLAGHLVCGFAGKKKKLYFGYRPEPVYYIY